MFNIPTIPEVKDKICSGVPSGSIADTMGDAADPDVGIIPGGPIDQAQQLKKQADDAASAAAAARDSASTCVAMASFQVAREAA